MCGLRLVPSPEAFLVADMPFHSYENPDQALTHATQLKEAGAKGVQTGGWAGGGAANPGHTPVRDSLRGTLGYASSAVVEEGGYRIKGRSEQEKASLLENAELLTKLKSVPWCLSWCSQTWLEKSLTGFPSPPSVLDLGMTVTDKYW